MSKVVFGIQIQISQFSMVLMLIVLYVFFWLLNVELFFFIFCPVHYLVVISGFCLAFFDDLVG